MKTESDELLLQCLRRDGGGPPVERLAALGDDGWTALLAAAGRHSLTPLLYHTLKPVIHDVNAPEDIESQLRTAYLASAARNMRLYHELGQVLTACNRAGIPVILLKGAHLAQFVYENIALRPMSDIDLLVKESDLRKTWDVLNNLGYTTEKEDIGQSRIHLAPFTREGSVSLEIHFDIFTPPAPTGFDLGGLWLRAKPVSIGEAEAFALSPEDLVLHLCLHMCIHHGFDNGLRPLFDIALIMEHHSQQIIWEQVMTRAEGWGLSRSVSLALSLAARLVGASVPDAMHMGTVLEGDEFDARAAAESLLFEDGSLVAPNIARLFNGGSVTDKLVHFVRCIQSSKQTMVTLNRGARPSLAYFFRIKGLLSRHVHDVFRILLGDKDLTTSAKTEHHRTALKNWLLAVKYLRV